MWDPGTYLRYGDERSRPFFDLMGRVGAAQPRAVVDAGCGPGTLTGALAERWPKELLTRWVAALPPGAWLAFQVPGNFDAPSHRELRAVAADYDAPPPREAPVSDAVGYADLLTAAGCAVDAWETTYVHLLPVITDDHPVLTWMEGTALRPIRAALGDADWARFRAELAGRLAEAYPARQGVVPFPFRRIFCVARVAQSARVEEGARVEDRENRV